MQLGMIGLGRMGANIIRRVVDAGHEGVVYDHDPDAVKSMAEDDNTTGVSSLSELAEKLSAPRVVWVMVPAGDITTGGDRRAGDDAGGGRHRHRRRQLLLPRRPQARKDAVREGDPPPRLWHQRWRVGPRARLLPDDRRRRLRLRARRAAVRDHRARRRLRAAHPGPRRRGRATREGLPALRTDRGRALREDGAQRHRVRDDGLARRGPEHLAQRRHRHPHPSRATPKPRRCRIPSATSTTSTSPTSPRCGAGAASSAPGCWT